MSAQKAQSIPKDRCIAEIHCLNWESTLFADLSQYLTAIYMPPGFNLSLSVFSDK